MCAIIAYSQPVERIRGALASSQFAAGIVCADSPKAGLWCRRYVKPANPGSDNQLEVRGDLILLAQQFSALGASVVADWNAAAAEYKRLNNLGQEYQFSGINLFCMVNMYRLLHDDGPPETTPPTKLFLPPPFIAAAEEFGLDGTTFHVPVNSLNVPADGFLLIRMSPGIVSSGRQARKNELRMQNQPPDSTLAANFFSSTHSAQQDCAFETTAMKDGSSYVVNRYCGIEITPLTADYVPGLKFFAPSLKLYDLSS